jgi:hypothetical protein
MSSAIRSSLSRREVLIGGAAVAGAGALAPITAQAAVDAVNSRGVSVLLHSGRITPDAALLDKARQRGARIVTLGEDPVRQWRDESAAWLVPPNARLLGITHWPDFLLLRGLAAESRRHVLFASPVSGDGVLTWLIA